MKVRTIILAGGEGTRLGVLTAKRTKPAVPFAGKYRIIDFALSNCVNSNLYDAMIIAQYRPRSLIEHIGSGGPWDLNRELNGGVRIYTPFRGSTSNWFVGTADAVQQNFSFVKTARPDLVLILSGDHVYSMDYNPMIQFHQQHGADLTMATMQVPMEEASRFGIVETDGHQKVTSFVEKPANPTSNLVNMGIYLFNLDVLDKALWEDHEDSKSSHDFGKNILPKLVEQGLKVMAYPYSGYWVDVGTVKSYWETHMDLLRPDPPFNVYDRDWRILTRTESQPPAMIHKGAILEESMVSQGCVIEPGARVIRSILSPGVHIQAGALVEESILLTDTVIGSGSCIQQAILDKSVFTGAKVNIGGLNEIPAIAMVGKNSIVPEGYTIEPGAMVGTDVIESDYNSNVVLTGQYTRTKRTVNEV